MAKFELKELPYAYNALEPYIDEETLHVHHDKHHKTYCDKFNAACEAENVSYGTELEIFQNVSKFSMAIRNHGGGFWNHQFYWESMNGGNTKPGDELVNAINETFGSMDNFKDEWAKNAAAVFGSGWTWLIKDSTGKLKIVNTPNQDNPLMDIAKEKGTPLLVIDVWEHAYYIKYQNRRPEYIDAFFNVIDWEKVSERFSQ